MLKLNPTSNDVESSSQAGPSSELCMLSIRSMIVCDATWSSKRTDELKPLRKNRPSSSLSCVVLAREGALFLARCADDLPNGRGGGIDKCENDSMGFGLLRGDNSSSS